MSKPWIGVGVVLLLFFGITWLVPYISTPYTKDIKTDECPSDYDKSGDLCIGLQDNVFYYKNPKGSITFHYPKEAKLYETTGLKKNFWYDNIGVSMIVINYEHVGYSSFDDYLNDHYKPNVELYTTDEGRKTFNTNETGQKTGEDMHLNIDSVSITGGGTYFGYDGWLFDMDTYLDNDPNRTILRNKKYLFPLDEPYAYQLIIGSPKNDFNASYDELLPYLNNLEIVVQE